MILRPPHLFSIAALALLATAALAQTQPPRPPPPASPAAPSRPSAGPSQSQASPAVAAPARPAPTQPEAASARPAAGSARPAAPAALATGPGGTLLKTHDKWAVYVAEVGGGKICYALSQPTARLPDNLSRDPAYLFITFRPGEQSRNEIALVMGFPVDDKKPAEAVISSTAYPLLARGSEAWLKERSDERKAIAALARAQDLIVKVQSRRGNALTDTYSLAGFRNALAQAQKECP